VPAGALLPQGWHRLLAAGPLAPVMLVAAGLWMGGAMLGAWSVARQNHARLARLWTALGFVILAVPWLLPTLVMVPEHSAWQGGVVLAAAALWFTGRRAAVTLAVGSAVPAAMLAVAVGPSRLWFGLGGHPAVKPPFQTLDTEPTYGPLPDRRTGATMLIVTAPTPGLWRMQTLDYYRAGQWIVGSDPPELPEPAARREQVHVRVAGLHEDLAVAPGRIEQIHGHGIAAPTDGEGMLLAPTPTTGARYREQAASVDPTAAQLSADRAPLTAAARQYTRLDPAGAAPPQRGELATWLRSLLSLPAREPALDRRVRALARRLATGARTEWEIVVRVERYLLDGRRFRYTTNVPEPGPDPLGEFLLRTHLGYCQQFAGAAALLLRLAGVPARVVSGFATGRQIRQGRYAVRDLDAHEWIEVYFEGYGWVPFNPTPAADPAQVAGVIDPLPVAADASTDPGGLGLGLGVALIAAVATGALLRQRRRRSTRPAADWFGRVVQRAAGGLEPSTTLAQVRVLLAARVGPCTAAIALQIERERFGGEPLGRAERSRIRVARALLRDLGLLGSLFFLVGPPSRRAGATDGPLSGRGRKF
jgi:transglutaminase-like putative cysteine protease